jgi:NAD(P)H-hydrate repair Nnr-like enzyme with NAD(P)H-hydrate dehydratase domain
MLGALLAQRFDPWQCALAAVWLHGAAVAGLGDVGVVASDVAPRAAEALRALRARR